MAAFTRKYSETHALAGFVALLGWLTVAGGVVLAVAMLSGSNRYGMGGVGVLGAVLTGAGLMLSGLLQVLVARVAGIMADTANNTAHLLQLQLRPESVPTRSAVAAEGSTSFSLGQLPKGPLQVPPPGARR